MGPPKPAWARHHPMGAAATITGRWAPGHKIKLNRAASSGLCHCAVSPFANKQILLTTLLAIEISDNKKKTLSETEEHL
jgi:hypothetical protein